MVDPPKSEQLVEKDSPKKSSNLSDGGQTPLTDVASSKDTGSRHKRVRNKKKATLDP